MKNAPNGSGCISTHGYLLFHHNGKQTPEHRIIMSQILGRDLKTSEIVHHIDKNRDNHDISNLMLFPTKEAHTKYHYEQGDLKGIAGANRKVLVGGKLICCKCKIFKEIKDFVTESKAKFGVRGVCKECYNKGRRKL